MLEEGAQEEDPWTSQPEDRRPDSPSSQSSQLMCGQRDQGSQGPLPGPVTAQGSGSPVGCHQQV